MTVALITGATGGIGSALCKSFLAAGYEVIATDLVVPDVGTVNLAVDLVQFAESDQTRAHAIARIRAAIGARGLDVLINNAAFQAVRPFAELDVTSLRQTMAVNVSAPFLLVQGLLDSLITAHGLVLNIGSIHASLTKPGFTAYATSKAAVHGMTRALAVELGGRVRVNAIAPAAIDTPMLRYGFAGNPDAFESLVHHHPAMELGTPEHIARLALFLASERSFYVSGAIVPVDGGIGGRLHDPA